ncbi:MAG: hypothetical protein GXO07_01330 [Crenarchaeota archaeon]|nr:hypothetical protein [Thermoproteota archaeon]
MIVIENLEEFGEWVIYEYEHAHELLGGELLITNVKDEKMKEELERRGIRYEERSVSEIIESLPKPWVVLDPKGEKELEPEEARGTVIIGGILGSHPPKGRTWELLTSRLLPKGVLVRNIGKEQFSIDGAAAVAWLISRGKKLSEIEKVVGLEIEVEAMPGMSVVEELPYAYPVVNGEVFFSDKVREYLARKRLVD